MAGTHSNYKFRKDNEEYVRSVQCSSAEYAVQNKWNIVVSDTNLNPEVRKKWKEFATEHGYTYKEHNFFTEYKKDKTFEHEFFAIKGFVKQCKERNLLREKSVPESVIDDMAEKYLYTFDKVMNTPEVLASTEEYIIVDVDGTVAHMHNRSPYNETKVRDDLPDPEVILSVLAEKNYLGRKVIVFSGRKEATMEDTKAWFNDHNVPYDFMFMRATDDNRSDDIVKYELYMQHVYGKLNVVKVYDDREKVCQMWRELIGLKVFQVEPGKF
jgi:predicted kinase